MFASVSLAFFCSAILRCRCATEIEISTFFARKPPCSRAANDLCDQNRQASAKRGSRYSPCERSAGRGTHRDRSPSGESSALWGASIDDKTSNFKMETSHKPRKELATQGAAWSTKGYYEAIVAGGPQGQPRLHAAKWSILFG
ncbi:hypothetical protein [Ramlibacter sp. AN1133]|uniref:hypothetical protein n=1 Tax=Ramlibacter sp. AN1133 TaxID=3133429 RepID=UPI0030C60D7F